MTVKEEIVKVLGLSNPNNLEEKKKPKNTFIFYKEYYWRPKCSPEESFVSFVTDLKVAFGEANVKVLECGDKWKPFAGGKPAKDNSHYFIKFTISREGTPA